MTPSTAKIVVDVVRYLRANGFIVDRGRQSAFIPPTAPIHVKNTSGEEIPAFACMQAVGTLEKGGQNYVEVDQPADTTGAAGWYLFNGIAPIETDGFGIAYDGPFVRMLTDGSAISAGDKWQPSIGAWTVEPGGNMIIAAGADDIETDVMRGFVVASANAGQSIEYTITSVSTTSEPDFAGLKKANVVVRVGPPDLLGTTVSVYDHSGCVFDLPNEELPGYTGWALWGQSISLDTGKSCTPTPPLTPFHWAAFNRCCDPDTGTYRTC